ncbi:MAG: cobalamin B12-binding domain-containing protein [Candidatus Brocadiae bacterium]|nr:cobalamin B12-binding domain-containing protein [Candidatus Brocadiia bacterium]
MAATAAPGKKIRVLVAKVGLDGHDRGAKVIACLLRDAGMEVIYTGLHQTPEMVVEAALQEDVNALGLSILSGAHMTLFPRVWKLMKARGLENVLLTGGGIIPEDDLAKLRKLGIGMLFGPGTPGEEVVAYIREEVERRRTGSRSGGARRPVKAGKRAGKPVGKKKAGARRAGSRR